MYCVCIVSSVTCRSSSSCACYVNLGTITTATCCHIVGLPPDYLLALLAPHDSSFLSSAADGQPYLYFFLCLYACHGSDLSTRWMRWGLLLHANSCSGILLVFWSIMIWCFLNFFRGEHTLMASFCMLFLFTPPISPGSASCVHHLKDWKSVRFKLVDLSIIMKRFFRTES